MQPEPQPCVGDINPDLSFNWEIQWEGETNWSYIGNQEAFDYVNFEEGNHIVRLNITDNSDGSEASDTAEITILPPIPSVAISGPGEITIKEGEALDLTASCHDNNQEEIECTYDWEIWENKDNGDLLFTYDTQDISLSDLTNEINKYDVMVRGADDTGTYSQWAHVFVTVNLPNEGPSAAITIHPDSLGGLTPEYYQFAELTFSSANSNDPDGELVSFNWWFNNEIVSNSANWISSFNDTGIYQVKLEVQDDNGVWSSKVSTNFKIIENTAPTVAFDWEQTENSFTFTSTSSDEEGSVVSFEWMIDDEVISNEENCTWTASVSGIYTVTFRAMDDGGLWSETSQTIESKVSEQKNFVAHFSSKTINPGDSFTMDFSNTTGTVDYFEIIVNNPNGSKKIYETTTVAYTLIFDKKGTYALDITVIWADGIPQGGLSDWYGPTIYVGVDDSEDNSDDDGAPKAPDEEDSGLPSLSMVVALIAISLVAINRRQR
jgi:PKD repeat protein